MLAHTDRLGALAVLGAPAGAGLLLGAAFGGTGLLVATPAVLVGAMAAWFGGSGMALRAVRARPVSEAQQPLLHSIVRELCTAARAPMPRIFLAPSATPNAFATGRDPRHAVLCATEGLLAVLDERELRAVLAHELSHVQHRDTQRASVAAAVAAGLLVLANVAMLSSRREEEAPRRALLGVALGALAAGVVRLAVGRSRELRADTRAAVLTGDPQALSLALRKLDAGTQLMPMSPAHRLAATGHLMIANPAPDHGVGRLLGTHPPMADRIARLDGMAGSD